MRASVVAALLALLAFVSPALAHESRQRLPLPAVSCVDGSPLAVWVVNAATASDCSTGDGTLEHWCVCQDGAWQAVPASSLIDVSAGGHITLSGTATYWDDSQVPGYSLRLGASAPGFESWATHSPLYAYFFSPTLVEEVHGSIQMSHRWAGTSIEFHVHWFPKTNADGVPADQAVVWCINYAWADYATVFPAVASACASTHAPADANVVQDKHYMTPVATIAPGTGADAGSSIFYFRLYRDATSASDNYEDDAGLLSVDVHFEANRLGSDTQAPD